MVLLFTMTEYRPPAHAKVELMLCGMQADTDALGEALLAELQRVDPEQEAVFAANLAMGLGFLVRTSADMGDLYWMPAQEMKRLAEGGAWRMFANLSPYLADGTIDAVEEDLLRFPDENGCEGVYGVIARVHAGLEAYGLSGEDGVLCVMAYSRNQPAAAHVLSSLLED